MLQQLHELSILDPPQFGQQVQASCSSRDSLSPDDFTLSLDPFIDVVTRFPFIGSIPIHGALEFFILEVPVVE